MGAGDDCQCEHLSLKRQHQRQRKGITATVGDNVSTTLGDVTIGHRIDSALYCVGANQYVDSRELTYLIDLSRLLQQSSNQL